MNPLIDTLLQQNLVMFDKRTNLIAEQYLDQSRHVAAITNQMFAIEAQMTRVSALNRVPSGLPHQLLEHNAVAGQPFNAPKAPQ